MKKDRKLETELLIHYNASTENK